VLTPVVEKIFRSREVAERCEKLGIVHQYLGPAELSRLLETQLHTIEKVAAEVGIEKK
jgi:tripartite-type tricarboxylate transporter receptor subunit TctC